VRLAGKGSAASLDRLHVQADRERPLWGLKASLGPVSQMHTKLFQGAPLNHMLESTHRQLVGKRGAIEYALVEVVCVILPTHQGKLDQLKIIAISLIDRHQTVKVRHGQAQYASDLELFVEVAQDLADFLECKMLEHMAHVNLADSAVCKLFQSETFRVQMNMRRLAGIDINPALEINRAGPEMNLQPTIAGLWINGFVSTITRIVPTGADRLDLGKDSGN
jgi:hypothetical protein